MRFAYPELRLLLLAVPMLLVLYWWARARRRRYQAELGEARLLSGLAPQASGAWKALRRVSMLLAVVFLSLAAARPQVSMDWVNVEQSGIDLVIALDISASMSAEDVAPNRLARAKQDIKDLLSELSGDRVALVVFSGEAAVQSPLTVDYSAIRLLIDAVEPGMLPRPGTALSAALDKGLSCFDPEDRSQARAIMLITDGEGHEGDVDASISALRAAEVRAYALGIGRVTGEPIPVLDDAGTVTYKADREGKVVMTRLDETTLQKIAIETGGAYIPVGGGSTGIDHIATLLGGLEEKAFEAGMYKLYEDRFVYFLVPGLGFLLLEFFMGDRRRRRP